MLRRLVFLQILPLFFLTLSANGLPDKIDSIDSVSKSLREIEAFYDENIKKTVSYQLPAVNDRYLSEKMKLGEFFFGKGEFAAAADLFYSVISLHPDNDETRQKALSKLAESLYRQKNYISAVRYYEMLFLATDNRDYKARSLKRIVESNYYLGKYAAAAKYYDRFEAVAGGKDSELSYYFGKSLFYDKRFAEAVTAFYAVEKNSEFYPQSRYFLGMLAVKDGKYDAALSFYEEIVTLKNNGNYHKFAEIRERAVLAAAKAASETGDFDKAAAYFLMIDEHSVYFAEAYFGLAAAYVKAEKYEGAVNSLRLVKYVSPYSAFIPKAEALEGALLLRTGRSDEAAALFNSMVEKYGKIQDELFVIDGKVFMQNGRQRRVSDFLMPYSLLVRSLLKNNRKFEKAVKLNESVVALENELLQLRSRESRIAAAVYSKNIATHYPPLIETAGQTVFLRDKIAIIRNNLVMMQKSAVERSLSDAKRREFERLEAEKRKILGVSDTSSLDPGIIRKLADEYTERVKKDGEEIHKISMKLASMAKDLEAVIALYAKERKISENDEKEFIDKVVREREALRDMISETDSCGMEVENEKNLLFPGGGIEAREIAIRERLNRLTDGQYALVKPERHSKISELMDEADTIDGKLAAYYNALNEGVSGLFDMIRISFEKEKSDIDALASELAEIRHEVDEMAVLAIYSDLNAVKTAVADFVQQGESGLSEISGAKNGGSFDGTLHLENLKTNDSEQLYFNSDPED